MTPEITEFTAPLTQAGQALESSRDSGYDLPASAGELIDNSLEAEAKYVRIRTVRADDDSAITQMAFADNGIGIPPDKLPLVLSLGYSGRYNSRKGMGRFGMGLKLASLAQSKAVEVYSRVGLGEPIYCTGLDLDAVKNGEQKVLKTSMVDAFPAQFADLMTDPETGDEFATGTLIVWTDIDRLPNGDFEGNGKQQPYQQSLDDRLADLIAFIARAYRRFLHKGHVIELDGTPVELYDPTFALPSPRVVRQFGADHPGELIQETTMVIEGHPVHVAVTLAPLIARQTKFDGGRSFEHLYLYSDNARAISMIRNDREIYYDIVPKMLPGSAKDNPFDRYIGVQISFPAALDEYFQVRNVKRGAEPLPKLRADIRTFIKKPVEVARAKIKTDWEARIKADQNSPTDQGREEATAAQQRAAKTAPPGQAHPHATPEEVENTLNAVAEDLGLDPANPDDKPAVDKLKQTFDERTLMIVDGRWPGKDMLDITHLSGKAILRLNHRHPFISDVYDVLKAAAQRDAGDLTADEVKELLTKIDIGLDVLFMAYAQAENMHAEPEQAYGALRTYWGSFAAAFVLEGVTNR